MCSSPLTAWSRLPELFNDVLEGGRWSEAPAVPPVDVRQEGDTWTIQAEVPGMSRDDVNITVEDNVLTISGKREEEIIRDDEVCYAYERTFGNFSRAIALPEDVDANKVKAELKNGVLSVTVPKSPEIRPKKVEVKIS